jgi:glycosyltransferase involved in cell wall biosynthesis
MGWTAPNYGEARVIVNPTREQRLGLVESADSNAIHVLSGYGAYPGVTIAHKRLSELRRCFVIQAESHDPRGLLHGPARKLRLRRRVASMDHGPDALLAIGDLAKNQYSRIVRNSRVAPFGYFTKAPSHDLPIQDPQARELRVVFAGSLIHGKGLDVALSGLTRVTRDWSLTVIGDGPERVPLEKRARRLKLHQIQWLGQKDNDLVATLMGKSDIAIVPSRYDGWGAVVNEALSVGTPVLCSSSVGASTLIRSDVDGCVQDSPSGIASYLQNFAMRSQLQRQRLIDRSQRRFSPRVGAQYLLQVLAAVRAETDFPAPPWER